ncbi:MAG TPA: hypothetical protein VGG56_17630 [Terracidiphilus sp.]|jgi:hypothetical protein
MKAMLNLLAVTALALGTLRLGSQTALLPVQQKTTPLPEWGKVVVAGRSTPYLIRHLPVSSFPELPAGIADLLNRRGCTIPQTYEAHRPENVVHASLERAGSSDWAVLCSVQGTVSLLVFFDGAAEVSGQAVGAPIVLASAPETQRLQTHDPSGVLGFNWGIDPASPDQVREAQNGLGHPPGRLDHDALADSVVEHGIVYHFYAKTGWSLLETPD